MSRLRKLITWTQYLPTSAPFWQMEIIHIIYISRYLKKPVQFYKMRWFWISRKDENMLEALKWNLNLELKLGCTQTSEKLVLRCQFTMSFLLSGNLFQNCQLFFLIKGISIYSRVNTKARKYLCVIYQNIFILSSLVRNQPETET